MLVSVIINVHCDHIVHADLRLKSCLAFKLCKMLQYELVLVFLFMWLFLKRKSEWYSITPSNENRKTETLGPRWGTWVPDRNQFLAMLEHHNNSYDRAWIIILKRHECQIWQTWYTYKISLLIVLSLLLWGHWYNNIDCLKEGRGHVPGAACERKGTNRQKN